jgi:hypothetical protein
MTQKVKRPVQDRPLFFESSRPASDFIAGVLQDLLGIAQFFLGRALDLLGHTLGLLSRATNDFASFGLDFACGILDSACDFIGVHGESFVSVTDSSSVEEPGGSNSGRGREAA